MMKAKHILFSSVLGIFFASALVGCNGKTDKMQAQLDSLYAADSLHQEDIKQMADFVNVMSAGLDSISAQEGQLQQLGSREGGLDKNKMRAQLQTLAQTLQSQRERLDSLQNVVKNNKSAYGQRIQKLIAYYKAQLDEKDQKIAALQAELDSKNANIAELNKSVSNLTSTNTALTNTVDSQKTAISQKESTIAKQDETIHTGYVAIGSSKELKSKGIIKGGFLAKKKFDSSNISQGNFKKVDIRNYNDIRIGSSNPKVLTQMPAGSYTIQKNNDGTSTLHITNVNSFWSVSKYLVIKL